MITKRQQFDEGFRFEHTWNSSTAGFPTLSIAETADDCRLFCSEQVQGQSCLTTAGFVETRLVGHEINECVSCTRIRGRLGARVFPSKHGSVLMPSPFQESYNLVVTETVDNRNK